MTSGFTITETITIIPLGLTYPGCFVTIKDAYAHAKYPDHSSVMNMNMGNTNLQIDLNKPYILTTRCHIYAQANINNINPLDSFAVHIYSETPFTAPITSLYNHLKTVKYADKTCVDV